MFGLRLILVMAAIGGLIAYIADKLGRKIGRARMSVFGLRPKYTSILLTVLTGILISVVTIGIMAAASQSARTALFGMEKLQKDMQALEKGKQDADEELKAKNAVIAQLDEKIQQSSRQNDEMEANLKNLNERYIVQQNEVVSLTESKDQLTGEVKKLEGMTEALTKGLTNVRGGTIFYLAGEVVYAGVLQGGLSHDENEGQLAWFMKSANNSVLSSIGIEQDQEKPVQIVWLTAEEWESAVKKLDEGKGNMLVRVRTLGNIVLGEPVVCNLEIDENQLIYAVGDLILSETVDLKKANIGADMILMNFLSAVNHATVEAGVKSDPITGKVGNINAATVMEKSEEMKKLGGRIKLSAYADGEITTAGPVKVKLEVKDD